MIRYLLFNVAILSHFLTFYSVSYSAEDKPHHVIVIMSDDQGGWDYSFMGNPVIDTPNIDAMAQRSSRLSRFYVSPVCTPTRASLMTGRYNYRTRAIDTYLGHAMMEPEEVTIAEVLSNAGYATGIFGKWHLGDNYPMRPQDQGFQEVFVHRGGGIGQPSDPASGENKYTDPTLFHNGKEKEMKGYVTDIIFDKALEFISKNHHAGKPSFTYLAPNAPHDPLHDVPNELLKKYQRRNVKQIIVDLEEGSEEQLQEIDNTNRIFAMIDNIDDNVGLLFQRLKELGIYENSLVFYFSDNGPYGDRFVGPHRSRKTFIEEGGIRSILLAHWPERLQAGNVNDRIAAHYDLFPTILNAVGVDLPKATQIDGIDIMPLLDNKTENWPDRKLYLQWHRGSPARLYENGAVISQTHKLSFPKNGGDAQLYNLIDDPAELNNLAEEQPDLVNKYLDDYNIWFEEVSNTRPDNYAAPLIHVGNEKEPTSVLTQQDWHNVDGKPQGWRFGAYGNWPVYFEKTGLYDFRIKYKKENDTAPVELTFLVDGNSMSTNVKGSLSEHTFKNVKITEGNQLVEAEITENEISRGVHQIFITKRQN
ncbi:arylsulfatase [Emcibacteraceae bacterium]|nr:arylsulfatase [Emcibacteraceae bacterium]